MSSQEKEAIVGRLALERKACKESIAALESKINATAEQLVMFGSCAQKFAKLMKGPGLSLDELSTAAGNVSNAADILVSLRELDVERRRLGELNQQLTAFGL